MTLSTYLWIHEPVDVEAVWEKCQQLVGAKDPVWSDDADSRLDGVTWRSNAPGQGFHAWLLTRFRKDGEPVPAAVCDKWCEEGCDGAHDPAYYLEINLDTAYGYSEGGKGCTELHADIIVALGEFLAGLGVLDWSWRNEYTGEIFHRHDGLQEFLGSGERAAQWYHEVAAPAIARAMVEGLPT